MKFRSSALSSLNVLLAVTKPFISIETVSFIELCVMTPDISYRSLTQIGLQIRRRWIKWRPCKAMTVFQAFIFRFKCYSILHFAVCQLLCWAFLFITCETKKKAMATLFMEEVLSVHRPNWPYSRKRHLKFGQIENEA